jgi:hypothetical protein
MRHFLFWVFMCSSLAGLKGQQDTLFIWVDGLCGMCKNRIEKEAIKVVGVRAVQYNVYQNLLAVVPGTSDFDMDKLQMAVAAIGHDTENYKADSLVYESLHECCHYRDPQLRADHLEKLDASATVSGRVFLKGEEHKKIPAVGASVYWEGTNLGTFTDDLGVFEIPRAGTSSLLVFSYIGEPSDSVDMRGQREIQIVLGGGFELQPIEITYKKKATSYSFLTPVKVQLLGEGELAKAACCNLSESFETTPSIDVSVTDAITGTRQIEMLGLSGANMLISRENIPDIRGLSAIYGLTYLPGTWLEGIQLSPGIGSVVNGFESISGQINVELKKPENSEKLYFNFYGNEMNRFEANLNLSHSFNEKLHAGLLLHSKRQRDQMDRNGDHFMDAPTGDQFIVANRWKFSSDKGIQGQFGIKGTFIQNNSGQLNGENHVHPGSGVYNPWLADMKTQRVEGWYKMGYLFPEKPKTSIGLQLSGLNHDQIGTFGKRKYDAFQQSFYANLIYQTILGNTNHEVRSGLSYQYDRFDESVGEANFRRNESVPGVYSEYSYNYLNRFSLVAGLRADNHNQYGFFVTPRFHLRFSPGEKTTWRLVTGRGQRTPSVFAENIGAMASSRVYRVLNPGANIPYGLNAEVAWNSGLSFSREFQLRKKPATLNVEFFHTRFVNQIVVDYDADPQRVFLYNLTGPSFATSFQSQLDFELFPRLDLRLAYRFHDVKTTYLSGLLQRPFVSRHKGFANMAYETVSGGWKFDATVQWQGPKRIPDLQKNPAAVFAIDRSPDFFVIHTQMSKSVGKKLEMYLGVENLFNFRQDYPVISADDPYSEWFDASMVWGPIFGRMAYTGLRYRIHRTVKNSKSSL